MNKLIIISLFVFSILLISLFIIYPDRAIAVAIGLRIALIPFSKILTAYFNNDEK